jgi:hypothetical protein
LTHRRFAHLVMPAKAGIHDFLGYDKGKSWISAFAGMTRWVPPESRSFGRLVSIIMNALTTKAAEIRAQIAVLEGRISQQRADLGHVMATLRMFDPSASAQPTKAKHAPRPRATFFAAGEISKRCRDALRDATGPVSADEIAVKAMGDKGLDPSDQATPPDMAWRLIWALHRLESAGQARKVGVGVGARSALAD